MQPLVRAGKTQLNLTQCQCCCLFSVFKCDNSIRLAGNLHYNVCSNVTNRLTSKCLRNVCWKCKLKSNQPNLFAAAGPGRFGEIKNLLRDKSYFCKDSRFTVGEAIKERW